MILWTLPVMPGLQTIPHAVEWPNSQSHPVFLVICPLERSKMTFFFWTMFCTFFYSGISWAKRQTCVSKATWPQHALPCCKPDAITTVRNNYSCKSPQVSSCSRRRPQRPQAGSHLPKLFIEVRCPGHCRSVIFNIIHIHVLEGKEPLERAILTSH